jgi:6-phosphogluconolactonase/glucosamine-6-phosphate isomerase/deaminase
MEYFFDTREEASQAAAEQIAEALTRRLDKQKAVSLVVAGHRLGARRRDPER